MSVFAERLTPALLRVWFAHFHPHERVGQVCNIFYCPVAEYFLSQPDVEDVSVRPTEIGVNDEAFAPPAWAAAFIRAVDEQAGPDVTAALALELLAASEQVL